jgi:hypothetical protein
MIRSVIVIPFAECASLFWCPMHSNTKERNVREEVVGGGWGGGCASEKRHEGSEPLLSENLTGSRFFFRDTCNHHKKIFFFSFFFKLKRCILEKKTRGGLRFLHSHSPIPSRCVSRVSYQIVFIAVDDTSKMSADTTAPPSSVATVESDSKATQVSEIEAPLELTCGTVISCQSQEVHVDVVAAQPDDSKWIDESDVSIGEGKWYWGRIADNGPLFLIEDDVGYDGWGRITLYRNVVRVRVHSPTIDVRQHTCQW